MSDTTPRTNRKNFWLMILVVLAFCSIPLLIPMVLREHILARKLQAEGYGIDYKQVSRFWWQLDLFENHGKHVTNETLETLSQMPHIRRVAIDHTDCGALDLNLLTKISSLTDVIFYDCSNLRNEELQKLNKSSLNAIWINDTPISGETIHCWKKCSLDTLGLQFCDVTDEKIEHISRMTQLERLYLHDNTAITDAGLEYLLKLKHLTYLELRRTCVTKEGIEDFRKKHPNAHLEIISDFGRYSHSFASPVPL